MIEILSRPWPWYVVGTLIGLTVPALLLIGNKPFGVSSNLRHMCAAALPCRADYFRYDWKRAGAWNLVFVLGVIIGGWIGGQLLASPEPVHIASQTKLALMAQGIHDFRGLAPAELFNWPALLTVRGLILMVGGGLLIGFGTAYGAGCTSGHAIAGLANRQLASLIAVIGFFAGGLLATHVLLPILLRS
jgi:uncharacterized membrane protein YedE/YeeE